MSAEDMRQQLELLGHDTKGLRKMQLQKLLMKLISPILKSPEDWPLKAKALELSAKKAEETDRLQKKEAKEFELATFVIEAEARKAEAEEKRGETEAKKLQAENRKITLDAEERRFKEEKKTEVETEDLSCKNVNFKKKWRKTDQLQV